MVGKPSSGWNSRKTPLPNGKGNLLGDSETLQTLFSFLGEGAYIGALSRVRVITGGWSLKRWTPHMVPLRGPDCHLGLAKGGAFIEWGLAQYVKGFECKGFN